MTMPMWSRAEVHLFLSSRPQRRLLQSMILQWIAAGSGGISLFVGAEDGVPAARFALERTGYQTTLRLTCSGIADPTTGVALSVFVAPDFSVVSDMGQAIAAVQLLTGHLVLGHAQKMAMFEASSDAGGVNANMVHHRHISLRVDGDTAAGRLVNVAAKVAQVWLLAYERLWLTTHAEYAPREGTAEDFVEFTAVARALLAADADLLGGRMVRL